MTGMPLGGRLLQVLTAAQIDEIHDASVRILNKVGVEFEDAEACRLFEEAGAKITGNRVFIPEKLLLETVGKSPAEFTLFARDRACDVVLGAGKVYYTNGFGTTVTEDLGTGAYRTSTLADLKKYTRLADSLENVHYCLHQVFPADAPSARADVFQAAVTLTNTRKNVHLSVESGDNIDLILQVAEIASANTPAERRPIFSTGATPTTPLLYATGACRRLIRFARAGIPVFVVSGAMAGGSAPVTLAGTLTVQNAEVLAGIVLTQLAAPGAPTVYGSFAGPMNMRSGKFLLGAPELALMNAATAQLCRKYGLPLAYGTGGLTDSPASDFQAGVEKSATLLMAALAGVEVIHDGCSGILDSCMIAAYSQLVLDNEVCSYVNRMLRGISVSPETIAEDLIAGVGINGNYLSEQHTVKHFRQEHHLPDLFFRSQKPGGPLSGLDEVGLLARQKARELIESNTVEFITPEQHKDIDQMLARLKS